ncbi:hypothetical protein [Pyxidicoccus xibeiensis]|uniref:hypothetical protein n=1 Tax=Pyxidicoccus xibeiensis TaxID=2906759 RepID=UPI0020A705A6|nr:hypothetical protein [Pyxidicoccus xibeiensis]MCP3139980.1 hypothetical protein [Pyxidicoccus xibeiensis]
MNPRFPADGAPDGNPKRPATVLRRMTVGLVHCLLWTASPFVLLAVLHVTLLEGLDGLLIRAAFGEDTTEYAAGYSDWRFRLVTPGMPDSWVRTLLGPPLEEHALERHKPRSLHGLRYSRSYRDGNYAIRVVILENGRVREKRASYWLD